MRPILALVEGQTEETFVREVLRQHLESFDLYVTPVVVATKRVKSGLKFKGGVSRYSRLRTDLRNLLGDRSAVAITTMFDYYGLPADFPGHDALPPTSSPYDRVEHLEKSFLADVRDPRFIPYLSLHEFEALLLTSPAEVAAAVSRPEAARAVTDMTAPYDSPEEVNDGPETHPAARLMRLAPSYKKTLHGPMIAKRTGLEEIRRRCPHFAGWLTRLEGLASS